MGEYYKNAYRLSYDGVGREVLLLGEDNPQSDDPRCALLCSPPNCAGHRLQSLILQLNRATYLSCWRTNLCSPRWNDAAALARAADLLTDSEVPWRLVVLLGAKVQATVSRALDAKVQATVSRALDADVPINFYTHPLGGITALSLPHPSGRCRVWNEERAYDRAARVFYANVPSLIPHMEPSAP